MINPNLEMLSRMRELQRMEAERAELQQEKAKRELRRKFAEKEVAEGCAAVDSERLQSLMKRWKELVVEREGDVVGRLQEAVSEKKDNTIEMRRSDAKIVKENIEMMVSGVCSYKLSYIVYSLLLWTTLIGPFMILIWQLDGVCLLILIKSALLFSDAR